MEHEAGIAVKLDLTASKVVSEDSNDVMAAAESALVVVGLLSDLIIAAYDRGIVLRGSVDVGGEKITLGDE